MADNTTLDAMSGGDVIATDDVGGVKYQRVKVGFGADGAFSGVESTTTNPLPVTTGTPPTTATDLAKAADAIAGATDTGIAMLAIRDDALGAITPIDGDYTQMRVNSTGALWVDPGTVAVTNSGLTALDGAISGTEMQCDILTSALPTGASTSALQTSGNASLTDIETNTDFGAVVGGGVEATALRVTLASDSTGVVSVDDNGGSLTVDNGGTFATQATLQAGSASIGTLGANSGVDIGDVDVTSISAGTNLIGDVGISGARTSGGTTIFRSIDLDETEEEIKATAGQVYWIHAMNVSAAAKYLKFYNATAATVVVGTTTPVLTFPLATQGDTNGAGFTLSIPNGIAFGTAITVAATTGIADADTGAPGANEVIVNIGYA